MKEKKEIITLSQDKKYRLKLRYLIYKIFMRMKKIDLSKASLQDIELSKTIANHHAESGGPYLDTVLDYLDITKSDSILDIGCGKGGALITLSRHPFRRIAGVDISKDLLETARTNFSKLKIKNIHLYQSDASKFQKLEEYNYIYMFNPFPCNIMKNVITNINQSLKSNPRKIIIIYNNPVCHETIINSSFFDLIKEFYNLPNDLYIYRAFFE